MITGEELYFFNEIIDSEEIYGLNKKKYWKKDKESKRKIIDSLIEKNILNSIGNINDSSFLIVQALKKYKNADSYIWINGEITSLDKSMECIYLKLENSNDIVMKRAFKSTIILYIIESYDFLMEDIEADKSEEKIVTIAEFLSSAAVNIPEDEILYLRKNYKDKILHYRVYFKYKNNVYRYNVLDNTLKNISSKEARIEIASFYEV